MCLQLVLPGRRGLSEAAGGGSGSGEEALTWQPAPPSRDTAPLLSPSSSSLWWPEEAPEQLRIGSFMGKRYMTHHIPPSEATTLPVGCEPSLDSLPSLSP